VTTYEITGPTVGAANTQSTQFAVTPNGTYTGTITVTPDDGESAEILTFTGGEESQFFTLTPTSTGIVSLVGTNGGGLDDSSGSYTVADVPGKPDAPTAVAGANNFATITFSDVSSSVPVTGYTVTSIPGGGFDQDAGSLSLTHTVTGLVSGTDYTFTVVATNAVGESVSSDASNTVTIPFGRLYFVSSVSNSPLELANYWLDGNRNEPAVQLPDLAVDEVFLPAGSGSLTYDGDITFNGVAHGEAIVTGDATYNTTYYDPVIPSGGRIQF
jgi:hypothetical protein